MRLVYKTQQWVSFGTRRPEPWRARLSQPRSQQLPAHRGQMAWSQAIWRTASVDFMNSPMTDALVGHHSRIWIRVPEP